MVPLGVVMLRSLELTLLLLLTKVAPLRAFVPVGCCGRSG